MKEGKGVAIEYVWMPAASTSGAGAAHEPACGTKDGAGVDIGYDT